MPSRVAKFYGPVGARASSSAIFKKLNGRSAQLQDHDRMENFVKALTRDLENLKPVGNECLLGLEWLHRVVSLALTKQKEAGNLIPTTDSPISKHDQAWVSEHFNFSTTLLEVCNSVRASISSVEHGHLLAKYAIYILEKHDTSMEAANLIRARKALQDWIEVVQYPQVSTLLNSAEHEDGHVRLQRILNDVMVPGRKATPRRNCFLDALHGAKTTDVLACTALTLAFSGKSDLRITEVASDKFEWTSIANYLLQRCGEQARKQIARGSNGCVEEIEDVNLAVKKLLRVPMLNKQTSFPVSKEEVNEMRGHVDELKRRLEILILHMDELREKIDEFFHSIIASRSALLSYMQASSSSHF